MPIIYALVDPREPNKYRYVGKTENMVARMYSHLVDSRKDWKKYHRANWIRKLLSVGIKPEFVVLETVGQEWPERERHWISRLRSEGHDLTNSVDGGGGKIPGKTGYKHTAEVRELLSSLQKGKPKAEDVREKISAALKGRKLPARSDEHRKKLAASLTGKKASEEAKAKMSAAKAGKKLPAIAYERSKAACSGPMDKTHYDNLMAAIRTDEYREKMSASIKKVWEKRRAQTSYKEPVE